MSKTTKKTKKNLVILESPSKAKTIKKILGSNYKIEACVGHVRDLPKSQFGVDVDNDYEPKYITIRGKGDILALLRKEAKSANKVYLATDPDREGEAISWHLIHALKLDPAKTERITFNEITKSAVKQSFNESRSVDMALVDAQQARRVLDRIVGYKISPLLWKKVRKHTSAGRVQSVVLKLICEREDEVDSFKPEEYWTLEVKLASGGKTFTARYSNSDNGKLESKEHTEKVVKDLEKALYTVSDVKHGTRIKKPPAPFTTSTMQQETSKLFGYAASKTMRIAQSLYEGIDIAGEGTVGLISYMRTDSMRISDEAYAEASEYIKTNYGDNFLPKVRPEYKSKRRSQDAHEAIRPTNVTRTPDSLKPSLSGEQYKLYKLIWERFIASQMESAIFDTLAMKIKAEIKTEIKTEEYTLRAGGSVLNFNGYMSVYSKNEDAEKDITVPTVAIETKLEQKEVIPANHFTQPPPRYSEGTMVRTMEDLGIGRPGTFASTLATLLARGYVTKENRVLYPTELGEIVNDIMMEHFENIINTDFTAKMEDDLDKVEHGEEDWKTIVREFYPDFSNKLTIAEEKIGEIEVVDEVTDIICENCGKNMVIKYGRFGKFIACPGFPECRNSKTILEHAGVKCPKCEGEVVIKTSKKNRKYFGCDNNPTCEFISWNLPSGTNCPECGEFMVEKGKKKPFHACSSCKYTQPVDEE